VPNSVVDYSRRLIEAEDDVVEIGEVTVSDARGVTTTSGNEVHNVVSEQYTCVFILCIIIQVV
jgi:hypothetical protein